MSALSRLIGIIHEYQTDSSSKPPAPWSIIKKNEKKTKIIWMLWLDKGRSISAPGTVGGYVSLLFTSALSGVMFRYCLPLHCKGFLFFTFIIGYSLFDILSIHPRHADTPCHSCASRNPIIFSPQIYFGDFPHRFTQSCAGGNCFCLFTHPCAGGNYFCLFTHPCGGGIFCGFTHPCAGGNFYRFTLLTPIVWAFVFSPGLRPGLHTRGLLYLCPTIQKSYLFAATA